MAAAMITLAATLCASAWVCDDAYITFRTVDNFAHGEGLRWNVAERVQSYTHPLWMFAISGLYVLFDDVYYTSLALSLVCTLAAAGILVGRVAGSPQLALLGLAPLVLSKSFVDYSSSGLENPLTHLLLAIFYWIYCKREARTARDTQQAFQLGLIAGLIGLNRLDALLFVAPALLVFLATDGRWRSRAVLFALALGGAPLVLWEFFSLFYYGFALPNTAYAKLATGVPKSALALQGLRYFADSLARDPIALVTTAAGIGIAFRAPAALRPRRLAFAAGVSLYCLYVIWIGGDFMSGRLFAAPLFCAAMLLCDAGPLSRTALAAGAALALSLALFAGLPTLTSGPGYGGDPSEAQPPTEHGIGDERAVYYPTTGLLRRWLGLARVEDHVWAVRGQAARDAGLRWAQGQALGFYGFYAGPRVHVLDMVGLSDPLLARLHSRRSWRIGHFERNVPRGYIDTLRSGSNRIAQRDLAAYYDALSRLVRDSLFDADRIGVIARFNLGAFRPQLDRYQQSQQSGAP